MKKIIVLIIFAAAASLFAAPKNWLTDYDAAVKQAAKDKKPLEQIFCYKVCKHCQAFHQIGIPTDAGQCADAPSGQRRKDQIVACYFQHGDGDIGG